MESNSSNMNTGEKRPRRGRNASTGDAGPTPVPKIKLQTLDDVRRELNSVYRDMRANRIDNGPKLAYVLGELVKLHMAIEYKKRIEEIERRLAVAPGAVDLLDADGTLLLTEAGGPHG